MKKIPYEVIAKNSRLTDFSEIREIVIANQVKNVPAALKTVQREFNKELGYFC